jgi:hypothetical protein
MKPQSYRDVLQLPDAEIKSNVGRCSQTDPRKAHRQLCVPSPQSFLQQRVSELLIWSHAQPQM